MATNQKKVVKVTFLGETKRLKGTSDYQALVEQTQKAFGQGVLPASFKFYYLDEENEIISINSQADLEEALSIEDFTVLKLQLAGSVGEARTQLMALHSDTMSMRESLNQSGFFNPPAAGGNPFDLGPMASPIPSQQTQRFEKRGLLESGFEVLSERPGPVSEQEEVPVPVIREVPQATMASAPSDQNKLIESVQVPKEEEKLEEEVTCFKCLGEKLNKRGRPCKKCNGTGLIRSDEIAQVLTVVRGEIKDYCNNTFSGLIQDYLKKKAEDQASTDHPEIICDNCEMDPVKGIRFKCSVCPDYDLCQNCEAQGVHPEHPLLKIRHPSHAPQSFLCQFNPGSVSGAPKAMPQQEAKPAQQKPAEEKARGSKKNSEKPKFVKYSGRFVKESFGDKHVLAAGAHFTKQWTLRNDGKTAWPEDTVFIQTNGDDLQIEPAPIDGQVAPEQEYTWTLNGQAPEKAGRYSAYFRMVTGNNYRFGHKVWVDILVEDKKEEPMVLDAEPSPTVVDVEDNEDLYDDPKDMLGQSEYPNLDLSVHDKNGGENIQSEPCTVEDLMKSVSRTPKELYEEKVSAQQDAATRKNLMTLFNLGFVNFEVNSAMLQKYGNNVETVAATLCEGMLSESCVQAIFKQ